MKYFFRGILSAIIFGVLMFGGVVTGFMVLCFLAVPPMLYMYYCLFKVIIAIIKVIAKGVSKTIEVGTKIASLPRKMKRERAEAELQAKIDAEAAPYKAMADNGDTTAIKEIAKVYYKNGKENEARKLYEGVADKGDVDAQLTLAKSYKIIGNEASERWATCVEGNPNASDAEKESARNQKQAIAEYEQYLRRKHEEELEQQRRKAEAYQAWMQKEMQMPVTGDFFAVRPGESCCMNDGSACRFCARRGWASDEGWCRSSRCYL